MHDCLGMDMLYQFVEKYTILQIKGVPFAPRGYTGRNPKTGEKVKIKPKKLPFFKVGKDLKERVDR